MGVSVRIENNNLSKVKEVLKRMGIYSPYEDALYSTCLLIGEPDSNRPDMYRIVHFKEMLKMFGREVSYDPEITKRCNNIALTLEKFELLEVLDDIEYSTEVTFTIVKRDSTTELKSKFDIKRVLGN